MAQLAPGIPNLFFYVAKAPEGVVSMASIGCDRPTPWLAIRLSTGRGSNNSILLQLTAATEPMRLESLRIIYAGSLLEIPIL